MGRGVLEEGEAVVVGDVDGEFEAEGVHEAGKAGVEFQHARVQSHQH